MQMRLVRDVKTDNFTLGKLTCGNLVLMTAEDAVREIPGVPVSEWKIKGRTAIPYGTYTVSLTESARFKRILPELYNVPGFLGIRIHSGNDQYDTEGCILVGMRRTAIGVSDSKIALNLLMRKIEEELAFGSVVTIEIC